MEPTSLAAFALGLMVTLQPDVPAKLRDSYPETAAAIARAADTTPLFDGEHGKEETAALLVGVAFHESHFVRDAVGDHGRSFGLFQSQPPTAGVSRDNLLDPNEAATAALQLLQQSMRVCRSRPLEDRLAWYAGGGGSCPEGREAAEDSRAFFRIARRAMRGEASGIGHRASGSEKAEASGIGHRASGSLSAKALSLLGTPKSTVLGPYPVAVGGGHP